MCVCVCMQCVKTWGGLGGGERESVCVCVQCVKFRVKRTESNFEFDSRI